jgi:hypothetical protein
VSNFLKPILRWLKDAGWFEFLTTF